MRRSPHLPPPFPDAKEVLSALPGVVSGGPRGIRFLYGGREMEDAQPLAGYGVQKESVLMVLPGGGGKQRKRGKGKG